MSDEERLENMIPIGFDLDGNLLLKSEDYHWLMEQAERVEELEKEKDEWKDTAQSYYMTNQELREQNKRYREALEEIARGRFSGASYKARKALEGEAK